MKRLGTFLILLVMALLGMRPLVQAQTCAAPTNVTVNSTGNPGNTTAVVSFMPSATAVSYTVRYYWVGDSTAAGMLSVNTTTSPVTLTGLRTGSGAYYRVAVVSNCAGGLTTSSPWSLFLVGGSGGPGPGSSCAAPTNISVTSPTATTAVVSFTPSATATSYTIRYFWSGDSTAAGTFTVTTTSSPVTLTGLRSASYYIVRVTSNCAGGGTATSGGHGFQTSGGGALACGTVTGVFSSSTPTSTYVGFNPVAGALSYTVQIRIVGDTASVRTLTVTSAGATFAGGLLPSSNYVITVVTNCANGNHSTPYIVSFTTPPTSSASCGSVTNVRTTAVTTNSATLSFTPVAGASNYTIRYYAVGSTAIQTLTTTSSPVTLTGLLPGTFYDADIVTNCPNGTYSAIAHGSFGTTTVANCSPVTNVTVTATSNSTAAVSFTPGAGNTLFYISYYVPGDSATYHTTMVNSSPAVLTGLIPGLTYTIRVLSICGTSGTATNANSAPVIFSFRGALATHAALGTGVVSLFPNPAQRATNVLLPAVLGAVQARLTLINNVGQTVRTLTVPLAKSGETQAQLDLLNIRAGLYTLRIQAGDQTASQRLAVE